MSQADVIESSAQSDDTKESPASPDHALKELSSDGANEQLAEEVDSTLDSDLSAAADSEVNPASPSQHTPETMANQGQLGSDKNLTPWVDYVPRPLLKRPESPSEAVQMRYEMLNNALIENEYAIIEYIYKVSVLRSPRYYLDYQQQSNANFRAVAKLKRRLIAGKPVDLPIRDLSERKLPTKRPPKAS